MYTLKNVILILILTFAFVFGGVYTYFSFFYEEATYISSDDIIADVAIQPSEALPIAAPYLDEHGTYAYRDDKPLLTHMVMYKDVYYITQTNYPAKNAGFYTKNAVKVHAQTGEVSFSERR